MCIVPVSLKIRICFFLAEGQGVPCMKVLLCPEMIDRKNPKTNILLEKLAHKYVLSLVIYIVMVISNF